MKGYKLHAVLPHPLQHRAPYGGHLHKQKVSKHMRGHAHVHTHMHACMQAQPYTQTFINIDLPIPGVGASGRPICCCPPATD